MASLANSDTFGYQVAAEIQRRRLGEAKRKACVCDGQNWNWSIFALHLLPWGFIGILDFLHLVSYLYAAEQAAAAAVGKVAWRCTSSGCVGPGRGRCGRCWRRCDAAR